MTARIDHIDSLIFDLDNTRYPPSAKLFDLIDDRMGAFIMRLLGCDAVEARRVQKDYFHDHGTTMAGLMRHHGVDPEHFLTDVHAIALDRIAPDARLRAGLERLPGRRLTRSEEHTSELQSLMRISSAVFCLKNKNNM